MLGRVLSFLALQGAGGLAGWIAARHAGLAFGLVGGGLVWLLLDGLRALRLLRWLRRADANLPRLPGVWGEVADRTRRALRNRERDTGEAQQRLQEFLAAIQASPNGVVLLDAQGRIEWCNQTAAQHLGIDMQRDLMQIVGNLVRDPAFAAYLTADPAQQPAAGVVIEARHSTASRPVRIALQLHAYGQGRKLLLTRDVTALEQADAMRRDFVANVSHEIRTPLTVLSGFVETLRTLPLDAAERGRYLALMAQQASRMESLVTDLLTLSRLEGSPPPGAAEWTPAAALLAHCEQEARGLSQVLGRAHQWELRASPSVELAGARAELLSAMSNLLSNAVRYTPAGGRIGGGWELLADGRVEFSVQDSGPGITPEHLPRLTERFYRVDRSRSRETGGTGLGLAIVKHVVQRHGGELRIDSTPGVGSRFAFTLPAARVRPVGAADPAVTVQPAAATP